MGKNTFSINIVFFACCLVFALLKIILVGGEEVIARYQPFDDFWQILAAGRGYWFSSSYDWTMYIHLPIYSFWVGVVHVTGVPLRIATEILFISSGFIFVEALRRAGISIFAAIISYALIIFHPASFQIFNYTLAGTFYSPMFLVTLASILLLWINRGRGKQNRYAVIVGICFAILWHTRKENILLIGLLIVVFVFLLYDFYFEKRNIRHVIYRSAIIVLIPALIICGSSLLVKTANFIKFGLFVSTEMDSSGYQAAYKALLRIKPDTPIRFVPVPRDVRYKAYSVSPAFNELKQFFEGEFGKAAALQTKKWMGIQDEIAAGWFYWALKNAAAMAGHHNSAVEADAYFHKVAAEINKALDNNEIENRFVFFSFLDPEVSNWLPYFLASAKKIRAQFISTYQPVRERDRADIPDSVRKAFDIVTNRRAALLQGLPVIIKGWVFYGDGPVTKVEIQSESGDILGSTNIFFSRPDVATAFSHNGYGNITEKSGITILVTASPEQLLKARFIAYTSTEAQLDYQFKDIIKGRAYGVEDEPSGKFGFAFDEMLIPNNPGVILEAIKTFIWKIYGKALKILEWAALGTMILMIFFRKWVIKPNCLFILVILGSSIALRGFLFSLVDASSWPGNQPRYLFPVMQIYGVFLFLLVYESLVNAFSKKYVGREYEE